MKILIGLVLFFSSISAIASPVNFNLLKQQEQKDIQNLMVSLDGVESLMRYQTLIKEDGEFLPTALRPTFSKNELGWGNCLEIDRALLNASQKSNTLFSLEILADIGLKSEYFQCYNIKSSLQWRRGFNEAFNRVRQQTSSQFINLHAALNQTSSTIILSEKTKELIPNSVSLECLSRSMSNLRKKGLSENKAREQTLGLCLIK